MYGNGYYQVFSKVMLCTIRFSGIIKTLVKTLKRSLRFVSFDFDFYRCAPLRPTGGRLVVY